jgi:hypothetical protein
MPDHTDQHEHHVVETAERARQGKTGQGVRYVLIFGTLGIIVAFAIVFVMLAR